MNFVDVQPRSFLDYAWTTPSPIPADSAKPIKSNRKQNRCCDQCRKGKRACDAAILEDTLLDKTGGSGDHPTIFHYSDVFGPLAPCSNCQKTKKACTFEWLRSQRVSQATAPSNVTPPLKRRRKNNPASPQTARLSQGPQSDTSLQSVGLPVTTSRSGSATRQDVPTELGVTFADFPCGIPALTLDHSYIMPFVDDAIPSDEHNGLRYCKDACESDRGLSLDHDSGRGSSLKTSSESTAESTHSESPVVPVESPPTNPNPANRQGRRKRRRRSSSVASSRMTVVRSSPYSLDNFLIAANRSFLTDGLLRVYHDSFENALSCWLTERTCPYSKVSEVSLANDAGPDWNRIYHRVFRLDKLAAPIRGRALAFNEDKAAARALNLSILAFASQWAQSDKRTNSKYPFHRDGSAAFSGNAEVSSLCKDFDRNLQIAAWQEAKMALQDAAEIESFRTFLAQIVFSMTQRPACSSDTDADRCPGLKEPSPGDLEVEDEDMEECEDLLSKLDLTIESDGPPVHLEQGLRLIHSLRSRVAMAKVTRRPSPVSVGRPKFAANRLDADDEATVDLLFWLGVMFDTLSSAMHKRPLVVSDEDSDLFKMKCRAPDSSDTAGDVPHIPNDGVRGTGGLWDDYLLAHQHNRLGGTTLRWPCSYEQAASLLCDAAPVKVLLFRKVTRIQTLLARNARGDEIEKAIKAALDVYTHWMMLYAPFIKDCIEHHESLPPRIQSWYICVTGHWHLATLLLADLIEIVDSSELSAASTMSQQRTAANFLARFREKNCRELSDIANCACPREDASFSKFGDFHFAVNKGALMTEPWTAVMIRAFAKAGVVLLESASSATSGQDPVYQSDSFKRADACVKALWYLGRKSDIALAAARVLGDAVKQRRKSAEDKVADMSSFLEAELWDGFENLTGAFVGECTPIA